MPQSLPRLAVGPAVPGWGSWDWVGAALVADLASEYRVETFSGWEVPNADAVVVVKHAPPPEWVERVSHRAALVYCPIDHYGDAAHIVADARVLRACARIVVHCRGLAPHFEPFAPTSYLDHPLKYAVPTRRAFRPDGRLVWVGVRSNLPPLVAWVNAHGLPAPLDVLTNPADPARPPTLEEFGFRGAAEVRVRAWSPELHRALVTDARAALDVKADDFRSRHKPPAKALDFVASGVPVALDPGSAPAEHLAGLGLQVPAPSDVETWLSERYWRDVRRLGERLSRDLAPERVARRWHRVLREALESRPAAVPAPSTVRAAAPRVYGLLVTADDPDGLADWCRSQLALYDAVVCVDRSTGEATRRAAEACGASLVLVRECDLPVVTGASVWGRAHAHLEALFGTGHWVMCCRTDEFCHHEPRPVAADAERIGGDRVAWTAFEFGPHPDETPDRVWLAHLPASERWVHYRAAEGAPPSRRERLAKSGTGSWDRVPDAGGAPESAARPVPFQPALRCVGQFDGTDPTSARWVRFDGSLPTTLEGGALGPWPVVPFADLAARYRAARALSTTGRYADADRALAELERVGGVGPRFRALVSNDRGALAAALGGGAAARALFRTALELAPDFAAPRANLNALSEPTAGPAPPVRIGVVSLLFNWPSTGGGNVHTAELTKFLAAAGYDVRHWYARFDPWGIGRVTLPTPHPAEPLEFAPGEWTAERIVGRFARAIDAFDPDWVVLTDSWNTKPLLAAATGGRRYVLRLQALECLCPLNNVRLLPVEGGPPRQCTRHQLATPEACARCVADLGHTSGDLHRAERALAGFGDPGYRAALAAAFAGAAAVLAVNPLTAAMVEPHARDVRVVTAGMDPARFPYPFPPERAAPRTAGRTRILFAGLTREWMKGYHVLRAACARLWAARTDFEIEVTDDPPSETPPDPWARYAGWQSQADLPARLAGADAVVVPTVAQEALGRTAVEAMAAGRPVVASRIGGLPYTVAEGATGVLCDPGDPTDLARALGALLDDPPGRARMGAAGRDRFERHYAWPAVIDRHYRPLFSPNH